MLIVKCVFRYDFTLVPVLPHTGCEIVEKCMSDVQMG